jgi:hypothetical protein
MFQIKLCSRCSLNDLYIYIYKLPVENHLPELQALWFGISSFRHFETTHVSTAFNEQSAVYKQHLNA